MGTGEFRRIHSRVSWMCVPVERSMTVSAPQRMAHVSFSTSSAMDEVTAELPMLALILTRKFRPIAIGSSSGWLTLAGRMARPRAISSRTHSGVISVGIAAPKALPVCCWNRPGSDWRSASSRCVSRMATYSISGVTMPWRA